MSRKASEVIATSPANTRTVSASIFRRQRIAASHGHTYAVSRTKNDAGQTIYRIEAPVEATASHRDA